MANKNRDESGSTAEDVARCNATEEDKGKAKKWFARARELGDKRQFDYALEYYVNGLEFWPDAVEDACKPLHGCAVARKQLGGKKPGFMDHKKRPMTAKDAKKAFLNSLWLFGHDPDKLNYIEGVARNASRLRAEDAAIWACGLLHKAYEATAKTSNKQFLALARLFEEIGDRAAARNETEFPVNAMQMGVDTLAVLRHRVSKDRTIDNTLRDLSTKLTILKGKYRDGSYRDSMTDREEQADLHDRDRSVQTDDRLDQLVAKAEAEFQQDLDNPTALNRLIELLCRRESDADETKAIGILVAEFKRTDSYRRKHMADDIRMKQLVRKARQAIKAGDEEAAKKYQLASLKFDLAVFKERTERYPTDNRVKFEYAVRLFRGGRYDDAIPLFQAARVDPKNRTACSMFLGRCFFRKSYFSQAISALNAELASYDTPDDDLGKAMQYWLGRSQEASGDTKAARATFGEILQLDYTYRDVRTRLDSLS